MSETGVIDVFFFPGPTPMDVFRQFSSVVGRQELPPIFALGYHQSRWNYQDERDVFMVNSKFEEYDIPYDFLWLDIEHTHGKRYFTWDKEKFPNPSEMIRNLASYGRKTVTIIDPHIKRDPLYHIHQEAQEGGHYVKSSKTGDDYSGRCWSGNSSWIDFISPMTRRWWAGQFQYDKYVGSSPFLYTWNDMNEPSVFDGPEVTMKKDAIHAGGWEHREVHNIYGMSMHRATREGLLQRDGGSKRPFVLSRSFYAGSQRWGAVWTGDNKAEWSHLEATVPMLLSMGIAGITFSGADVGGFFGNPSRELLLRWYQAGAFQPFFRSHAHIDTVRREPWIFGEFWTNQIRKAVVQRYTYLTYFYTVFYQSSTTGVPVMRPLWVEFPHDYNTFSLQSSFLLGRALLVTPVTAEGQVTTKVSLPREDLYSPPSTSSFFSSSTLARPTNTSTLWYDLSNGYRCYWGGQSVVTSTPLDRISVFQRGGTIVPRKFRVRRCSSQMHSDPVTLVVALGYSTDSAPTSTSTSTPAPVQVANGELYHDDGETYGYHTGSFLYMSHRYVGGAKNATLVGIPLLNTTFSTSSRIEKITILGVPGPATRCHVTCSSGGDTAGRNLATKWMSGGGCEGGGNVPHSSGFLVVRKPDCRINESFIIDISFQ
eukprot:TRINITY_DN2044_c0_g1_i3.p1 TRINITY_DN2044_c0_g1~~TRINITY_DN2044_c0_g1_i3.p1  ORF type:complete len:651 (-),score=144.68 TRINITY_DN2044_c0_g1_i3:2532-4484(-)